MTTYYMSEDLTLYPVIAAGIGYQANLNHANNNNNNPGPDIEYEKDAKLLRRSRIDQARLALMTEAEKKKLEANRRAARKSAAKKKMQQGLTEVAVIKLRQQLNVLNETSEYLKDHLKGRYAFDIWPAFGSNLPYNDPEDFCAMLEFHMIDIRNAPETEPNQVTRLGLFRKQEDCRNELAEAELENVDGTKAWKVSRGKKTLLEAQNKLQEWDLGCAVSREKCVGAKFCEFAVVLNGYLRELDLYLLPEKVSYDHPMEPIHFPPRA